MMFILMVLASAVGMICALVVYLLLRRRKRSWRRASLIAGLFPPAVMGYLLVCLIFSSAISGAVGTPDLFFGDINESLPNGFSLQALDRMPDAGHIQKRGEASIQLAWIGSVQVHDSFVLGKYDYTYFPKPQEKAKETSFCSIHVPAKPAILPQSSELATAAGKLMSISHRLLGYQGSRTLFQRIFSFLMLLIAFLPPLVAAFWLIRKFQNQVQEVV